MDSQSNNENQNSASTSTHDLKPSKIKFQYEEDDEQVVEQGDETVTESSNLEIDEDTSMCDRAAAAAAAAADDDSIVDGDKTSADYYFDSYSHFGQYSLIHCSSLFTLF